MLFTEIDMPTIPKKMYYSQSLYFKSMIMVGQCQRGFLQTLGIIIGAYTEKRGMKCGGKIVTALTVF